MEKQNKKEEIKDKNNSKKKTAAIRPTIRNVLGDPFYNFWPLLQREDEAALKKEFERSLPLAKLHKGVFSRKKLKSILREKSKEKRKLLWKQKTVPGVSSVELQQAKENRTNFLLGVNAVTRGLEKSNVACCVIAGDIINRLLVRHVITMAARYHVPVVVSHSLRDITKTNLGIPCISLALKKCVSEEENKFHTLYKLVKTLSDTFAVPEHLELSEAESEDSKMQETESEIKHTTGSEKEDAVGNSSVTTNFSYIYRNPSTKLRAFVPPKYEATQNSISALGEFISLAVENDPIEKFKNRFKGADESEDEIEEEDDDDDDDDDLNDILVNDDSNVESVSELDNDLFFIDKKQSKQLRTQQNIRPRKRKKSQFNLKPLVVKKIKGNPKKIKKKKL